ncbi:paraquat-inducible protein A [Halomonas sp. XH26]|uniref:Paraquat-inducible protein A n=1 Tax=Vreelandella alkaliphila TaxID=272774 RepID=A0AAJ2S0L2_9GAMM|nr:MULTISPECIES: paraquat-inducible protein A [Halomonas]MCD6006676.1 paraquat-inducible protein A [Halomonas sp. IOP_6]MCD6440128.1 paraquat-inducible protein A [Halomonas sp.]MDX5979541.1 paraquat-inducible protein A [Halomonas alkaliphila]UTA81420.1 paraquat-inducible protein A [Halomonas sp. XH26]
MPHFQFIKRPSLQVNSPQVDCHPPETRAQRRRLRACHECDWVSALPPLGSGEKASCPRCSHVLVKRHRYPAQRSMALALSSLIALLAAVSFPFVSFSISGIGNRIELSQTATTLISFHQPVVAIAVIMTIVVLPAIYLIGVIWLQFGLLRGHPMPFSRDIARSLARLNPWMMADVFIVGALVSLIKIAGMAQVELGISFWAFSVFAILLLLTTQSIDSDWMWFSLEKEPLAPEGTLTGTTAASQGVTGCPTCGLINRLSEHGTGHCRRCQEKLHPRLPHSLQRTWALLFAAAVMYIPANVYPIMTTTSLGHSSPSTIIGGVVQLVQMGSWPVAVVIFVASVIVPVGKLVALIWLCMVIKHSNELNAQSRTRLYRLTEFIGRWSMVDVFVVSILVALIRAGSLMSITPGPAALAFAAVVVFTMLAAMTFDPRLIWDTPTPRSTRRKTATKETVDG